MIKVYIDMSADLLHPGHGKFRKICFGKSPVERSC